MLFLTVFTFNCKLSPTVYEHFSSRKHFHRRPVIQEINSKHHAVSATVNQVNQVPHWSPHVLPFNTPRSTARSATFNHTLRHVQPHATSRSTPRYVIRVNLTFTHDSSLPFTHQFAHRFCSPPPTKLLRFQHRTLTFPAPNSQFCHSNSSSTQHSFTS